MRLYKVHPTADSVVAGLSLGKYGYHAQQRIPDQIEKVRKFQLQRQIN